jgi:CheY-specific phosphatase CheX
MTDQISYERVSEAVNKVLETMFFSVPLGTAEPETGAGVLEARLAFHGYPDGTFFLSLSAPSARMLAADFLGEEPETLADSAPGHAVCELANMICGTLLSQVSSEGSFQLDAPELVPHGDESAHIPGTPPAVQHSFQLENGILTVTLYFDVLS